MTDLAAALDAIRERSDRPVPHVTSLPITHSGVRALMESAADVPRLVAAVDEVLKLHSPIVNDPGWCHECTHSWPCQTVRAITSGLTGGETSA